MTDADEHEREPEGDDIVAAEYVLGVQSAEERAATARRIESDAAFARLVDAWEMNFSPLALSYEEAPPPAALKAVIERRLFSDAPQATARPGLWQSLALWRGLTVAAFAALALAIALPLLAPPAETPREMRLIASLAADDSDVRYMAVYDPVHDEIGLSHVSGAREEGRDFELWVIEGDDPPVSLGVIPVGGTVHLRVPGAVDAEMSEGMIFAISLEPAGGSPSGLPTGPVVAAGDLRGI